MEKQNKVLQSTVLEKNGVVELPSLKIQDCSCTLRISLPGALLDVKDSFGLAQLFSKCYQGGWGWGYEWKT